jgi:hypothetical protein
MDTLHSDVADVLMHARPLPPAPSKYLVRDQGVRWRRCWEGLAIIAAHQTDHPAAHYQLLKRRHYHRYLELRSLEIGKGEHFHRFTIDDPRHSDQVYERLRERAVAQKINDQTVKLEALCRQLRKPSLTKP